MCSLRPALWGGTDDTPQLQLLFDVGAHQDLRTLLVAVEELMGAAELVALQPVQ